MRPILLSLALVTAGSLAMAQDIDTSGMDQAISMLQTTAQRALDKHGVEADATTLSLAQLAQLKAAIDGGDSSGDMSRAIRNIIAN